MRISVCLVHYTVLQDRQLTVLHLFPLGGEAQGCHLQNDLGGAREGEGAALREGQGVEDGEPGLGLVDPVAPQGCVRGGAW